MEAIPKRKYNSKYSNLTDEERKKIYRESAKEWKKKVGYEKQYEYLHGDCLICDRHYANIYEHYKSKKHQAKVNNNIPNISEHADVLLKV